MSAIALTLALAAIVIVYSPVIAMVFRHRRNLSCMTGMMIGMCVGMMVGLSTGFAAGVTLKVSPAVTVGVMVGMAAGALAGAPVSFMAALDGVMAGLMGGMMGAMLGLMVLNYGPMPMFWLLLVISLGMAGALGYLIHQEVRGLAPRGAEEGQGIEIGGAFLRLAPKTAVLVAVGLFFFVMYSGLAAKGGLSFGASGSGTLVQEVERVATINQAGTLQEVTLKITEGRLDAKTLVVKRGIPVKLTIDSKTPFCFDGFYSNQLGVAVPLTTYNGLNEILFTPEKTGEFTFACTMNMIGGTVRVID